MGFVRYYSRGILSLGATVLVALISALSDNRVTAAEWLVIAGALVGTVAVVGIPNTVTNPAIKPAAQVLAPVLSGFATALLTPEGITATVMATVGLSALAAIGVYSVKTTAPVKGFVELTAD